MAFLILILALHTLHCEASHQKNDRICFSLTLDLYSKFLDRVCSNNSLKHEDGDLVYWLPMDCKETYNIQTKRSCNQTPGWIQLNISDEVSKNTLVKGYRIENCSTCHNFSEVNFTYHLTRMVHLNDRSCLNGTMDTTTKIFTNESSNTIGLQIKYVVIIAAFGFAFGVLVAFAVWVLRNRISTLCSQITKKTTLEKQTSIEVPTLSNPRNIIQRSQSDTHTYISEEKRHVNKPENSFGIYNHLNETRMDEEDTGSTYDHAQHISGLTPTLEFDKDYTTMSDFTKVK